MILATSFSVRYGSAASAGVCMTALTGTLDGRSPSGRAPAPWSLVSGGTRRARASRESQVLHPQPRSCPPGMMVAIVCLPWSAVAEFTDLCVHAAPCIVHEYPVVSTLAPRGCDGGRGSPKRG